jgi:hypothetical protein
MGMDHLDFRGILSICQYSELSLVVLFDAASYAS